MGNIVDLVKSSRKLVGFRQVMRGITDGTVGCVLVSADADECIKTAVLERVAKHDAEYAEVMDKAELGRLCGVDVPAAVVGILR